MIKTSRLTGWVTGLAVLLLLLWSDPSFAQSRPMTVGDAIEMQTFVDPYPFPATELARKDVKFSPDNRFFVVVTRRGLLTTNELESTIWLFDAGTVGRFLSTFSETKVPTPKAIARMGSVTNDSSITQLRWLSVRQLAFLGRDKNSARSLYTLDVVTQEQKKLTPDGQDVTAFDIAGSTVVYTVAEQSPIANEPLPNERILTGRSILSLIDPKPLDFLEDGKLAKLWIIRNGKASPVLDQATGKPVQLLTTLLSLSPSGGSIVVTQFADYIPESWVGYEPNPCPACETFRLKASPSNTQRSDLAFRMSGPKQYALVSLVTGRVEPIDAPLGLNLLYAGPEKAIWLKNGQSLILVNTYLPLENTDGPERQDRLQKPCVAFFDDPPHGASCIAKVEQTSGEETLRTGFGFFLSDVIWDEVGNRLVLSYETWGNDNDPTQHEHTPEVYRFDQGQWIREAPLRIGTAPVRVAVRQDLNEPPSLFVSDPSGRNARKLWDPNPQLAELQLGEASVFQWQDKAGRVWVGGLVKPPNYQVGRRYPLVIQTHGFNRHEFMTVGAFTTAFAARPIAATGIMVLQIADKPYLQFTPEEASINVDGFLSAIDHLANDGLVDPERVGIIGFSRTGYYVLEGLTTASRRFAAATIADSDCLGYMQRLLGVDDQPGDWNKQESIRIYGALPFGSGLKRWLEEAPALNLDKVVAPVRIEAHDVRSLLYDWEIYAALRLQEKPVDLIQLPNAIHEVTKPFERLASEQGDVDWFDFWLNSHEDPDPAKVNQYVRWRLLREMTKHSATLDGSFRNP